METAWDDTVGMTIRPGTSDEWIVRERAYDFSELGPTDLILDVGAHIGSAAVRLLREGHPVVAIEPEPENLRLLQMNTEAWGSSITVYAGAVVPPGSPSRTALYRARDASKTAMHSLRKKNGYEPIKVEAIDIVNLLQTFNPVGVKLDCEGAEYDLLPFILRHPSVRTVAVELHLGPRVYVERFNAIPALLAETGFTSTKPIEPRKSSGWARVFTFNRER